MVMFVTIVMFIIINDLWDVKGVKKMLMEDFLLHLKKFEQRLFLNYNSIN
jgi:hypothetical protein